MTKKNIFPLPAFGSQDKNLFPEFINGLDVRPLGLSGRTVRLLRLRPQVLASAEQQAFLLDWLPAVERLEAVQQIEEEQGLWATPVWDVDQLELWLDTLAVITKNSWTEGWDSFAPACGNPPAAGG